MIRTYKHLAQELLTDKKTVMKKLIIIFVLTHLISVHANAQTKPKSTDKPPTKKEMDEMMKQAQKEMDNLSPEDKKMMEAMGIKIPDFKKIEKDVSGVSEAQLKSAYENESRLVPKKDLVRIAAIPSKISMANIGAYIRNTNTKTNNLLSSSVKKFGNQFYNKLNAKGKSANYMGNAAINLWMMGYPDVAFYLMEKACEMDASNSNNLSNYASMLTLLGAPHLAIPLLNTLNSRFPQNSTLLNNLGQAWFGLGDLLKAEKYLDSAIRIYAYHPQANYTKCFIEESKGKKAEAIAVLKKSMKHGYTKEKEEKLHQLDYKPTADDFLPPGIKKADPLNLGGFRSPAFPISVDECISLGYQWDELRKLIDGKIADLKQLAKDAQAIALQAQEKRMNADIALVKMAMVNPGTKGTFMSIPLYADRASKVSAKSRETYERKLTEISKRKATFLTGDGNTLKVNYEKEMEQIRKEDGAQTGEGKGNKDFCPRYKEATDKFLNAYNSKAELFFKEYLEVRKEYLNEDAHWNMYILWPEAFEVHKMGLQIQWLTDLKANAPWGFASITKYLCKTPPQAKQAQLQKFDDVACQYHSELKLPFAIIKSDCSSTYGKFDADFVAFSIEMDADKQGLMNQFVTSTIEVGAKIEREVKAGGVEVGVSGGSRLGIEIDRTGLKDAYVIGSVSTSVKAGPLGADAGLEGKISIISSKGNINGTGLFEKLR